MEPDHLVDCTWKLDDDLNTLVAIDAGTRERWIVARRRIGGSISVRLDQIRQASTDETALLGLQTCKISYVEQRSKHGRLWRRKTKNSKFGMDELVRRPR